MKKWIYSSIDTIPLILLSAVGVYLTVFIYTRIAGKRSFSKMSSFDFAMTIAVGSIIATTIMSKSVSLVQGMAGLFSLYALQLITAQLRKLDLFEKIIDNKPLLIMRNGEILKENLSKALMTESDLKGKLREANVIELSEVKAVIFETTGDVSVLHTKDNITVDDWILEGVQS